MGVLGSKSLLKGGKVDGRGGCSRIDGVWTEEPVWERCCKRKAILKEGRRRLRRQSTLDQRGRDYLLSGSIGRGRKRRAKSEEVEWRNCLWQEYDRWKKAGETIPGWPHPMKYCWQYEFTPIQRDKELCLRKMQADLQP